MLLISYTMAIQLNPSSIKRSHRSRFRTDYNKLLYSYNEKQQKKMLKKIHNRLSASFGFNPPKGKTNAYHFERAFVENPSAYTYPCVIRYDHRREVTLADMTYEYLGSKTLDFGN
jgi:hypothetical protein